MAVFYADQCYLAFREIERVKSFSSHFDWLVRAATRSKTKAVAGSRMTVATPFKSDSQAYSLH